ncbi:MAG: hypothetical protein J1E63_04230, partial [Muribaculaceae bacterium]|nr:hypothetical protein [Muribaculaceae bacterium]
MKNSLSYLLIFLCFLGLISCSKDKPKWDETKDGVKLYHPFDNKLLGIPSIEWIGDTTYFGLAHGKGKFIYKDKNYPENNVSKNVYAHYGNIEEIEDLDNYIVGPQNDKGALDGFGVRVFRGRTTIGKASD